MIIWFRQQWLKAIFASLIFQGTLAAKNPLQAQPTDDETPWDDSTPVESFDPEAFVAQHPDFFPESNEKPTPLVFGVEAQIESEVETPTTSPIKMGRQELPPDARYTSIQDFLVEHHKLSDADATQIANEVLQLFLQMRAEGRRLEREMESEDFEADLERGKVRKINGVGRAKVTRVHGVKWIRVVHKRVPTAFTFFNHSKVEMDSEHVHLIHANNHFNSGKNIRPEELPEEWMRKKRAKGALFGRDELATLYHEKEESPDAPPTIEESQLFLRPTKGTAQYDYEFKLACDKPFSASNMLVNGTLMGLVQVGIIYGLNVYSPHIPFLGGHMDPVHPLLLAFTFAYSHYAGGWLYPKLRARAQSLTYNARFWLRGFAISLPYAIVYKAFITHQQFLDAWYIGMAPLIGYFVKQGVNIGINFYINNRVSNELNEHTQLDQELRTQQGFVGGEEGPLYRNGIRVKRIDFMGQIRYVFVSFLSRTIDLNDNLKGFKIHLPLLDMDYLLSAGKIFYLGLASALKWSVMHRAEKNDAASAAEYRRRWEKSLSGFIARKGAALLSSASVGSIGRGCRSIASKLGKLRPSSKDNDDFSGMLF